MQAGCTGYNSTEGTLNFQVGEKILGNYTSAQLDTDLLNSQLSGYPSPLKVSAAAHRRSVYSVLNN